MTSTQNTDDLLSLIGTAIDKLRQSIELFETSSQDEGIVCLSEVIREIDEYMNRAHNDPLLHLARIEASALTGDLDHIKNDLVAVIEHVDDEHSASSS